MQKLIENAKGATIQGSKDARGQGCKRQNYKLKLISDITY